jgi:hypothetical protein
MSLANLTEMGTEHRIIVREIGWLDERIDDLQNQLKQNVQRKRFLLQQTERVFEPLNRLPVMVYESGAAAKMTRSKSTPRTEKVCRNQSFKNI